MWIQPVWWGFRMSKIMFLWWEYPSREFREKHGVPRQPWFYGLYLWPLELRFWRGKKR
jgi:hypothetical protein